MGKRSLAIIFVLFVQLYGCVSIITPTEYYSKCDAKIAGRVTIDESKHPNKYLGDFFGRQPVEIKNSILNKNQLHTLFKAGIVTITLRCDNPNYFYTTIDHLKTWPPQVETTDDLKLIDYIEYEDKFYIPGFIGWDTEQINKFTNKFHAKAKGNTNYFSYRQMEILHPKLKEFITVNDDSKTDNTLLSIRRNHGGNMGETRLHIETINGELFERKAKNIYINAGRYNLGMVCTFLSPIPPPNAFFINKPLQIRLEKNKHYRMTASIDLENNSCKITLLEQLSDRKSRRIFSK